MLNFDLYWIFWWIVWRIVLEGSKLDIGVFGASIWAPRRHSRRNEFWTKTRHLSVIWGIWVPSLTVCFIARASRATFLVLELQCYFEKHCFLFPRLVFYPLSIYNIFFWVLYILYMIVGFELSLALHCAELEYNFVFFSPYE